MPVCLVSWGEAGFEDPGRLSRSVCVPDAIHETPDRNEGVEN